MHTKIRSLLKTWKCKDGEAVHASFFVLIRHGKDVKASDKRLNFHMCLYTVRYCNKRYDSVLYDPAPEFYGNAVPSKIRDFKKIEMRSSTLLHGANSYKEDCVYQCMKYAIELHSGKMAFQANSNCKNFKISKN